MLSLVHGWDDVCEYSLSLADGEAGMIGADMKWLPLGVGNWSLKGESQSAPVEVGLSGARRKWLALGVGKLSLKGERQSAQFAAIGDGDPRRPRCPSTLSPPSLDSSSSSIIVLRERRRCETCTGDGAWYVVAGNKSSVAILIKENLLRRVLYASMIYPAEIWNPRRTAS